MVVALACMSVADFDTGLLNGAEVYHVFVSVCWRFYLRTLIKKNDKKKIRRAPKAIQDDSVISAIL